MAIGKRAAQFFKNSYKDGNKAFFGLAVGTSLASGLISGANNEGALTNRFVESTLGTSDIDNEIFGSDMGLLTDLRAKGMVGQSQVFKYGGAAFGAATGAGTAYTIGSALRKSNNARLKTAGTLIRTGGAVFGGVVGGTAGYVGGSLAPVSNHIRGPLVNDYMNQRMRSQIPTVSGDIVFGMNNLRHG